jgi:hypothetical protein
VDQSLWKICEQRNFDYVVDAMCRYVWRCVKRCGGLHGEGAEGKKNLREATFSIDTLVRADNMHLVLPIG